jgi:DNA-binding PadR family transcriptional regulator
VTEQAVFILTCLAGGELHGYAIARETSALSGGRVRLTAGTLYGALGRLQKDELIEEAREEVVDGRKRRYYRLTPRGRRELSDEATRLDEVASIVRERVAARPAAAGRTKPA